MSADLGGCRVLDGNRSVEGRRFAILAGRFYDAIADKLVEGALSTLRAAGVADADIELAWAPGAVELPLLAQKFARRGDIDAVVALGCVIRGGTTHYDYVCQVAAEGLSRVSLDTGVPVAFGVLTCENRDQAYARCDLPSETAKPKGNKGEEAAQAALEMVNLLQDIG